MSTKTWEDIAEEEGVTIEEIEHHVFTSAASLGARRIALGDGEVIKFASQDELGEVYVYVSRTKITVEIH